MLNSLTYGGIITKVKAMSSNLVSHDEYDFMAQLESTADYINFLRTKPSYQAILNDVNETTIHRGQIEERLKISLLMDFSKIYTFATRDQRIFLDIFFFRYEVAILKDCLKLIYNQKKTLQLVSFRPFFDKHSDINLSKLTDCNNMDEFIQSLQDSKYYNLFSNLHNSIDNISLSDYETQLDIFFFSRIWKFIKRQFKGKEKKRMQTLFGTQIDMLNIMWIYRSKKYYNINTKEIYITIIPIHYHLTKEQLIKLVEAPDISELIQTLSHTYYHYLISSKEDISIERQYTNQLKKLYQRLNRESSHSMLHTLYYLFLKEEELDHITTLLECIRYHMEPATTLKYIFNT